MSTATCRWMKQPPASCASSTITPRAQWEVIDDGDCLQIAGGNRKDAAQWPHRAPDSGRVAAVGCAGCDHDGLGESVRSQDQGIGCEAGVQGILRLPLRAVHVGE